MSMMSNDNTELSSVRNTIKRLNIQAQRRAALPDRAIAESDLGDVQPWGIGALVAMVLGIIAYSFARALSDIRRPFLKAEDNAKLAKQYAKESQKLAKQAKGYAKKAKAEAQRHQVEAKKRKEIADKLAEEQQARARLAAPRE